MNQEEEIRNAFYARHKGKFCILSQTTKVFLGWGIGSDWDGRLGNWVKGVW